MFRRLIILIILIYWIAVSFNASLIGSGSYFFYCIVGICLSAFILERCSIGSMRIELPVHMFYKTDDYQLKFKNNLKIFILIVCIYIILSFLGLGTWFGIDGLGFDRIYIMRHAYFILTVPIGYFLAEASYTGILQEILTVKKAFLIYIVLTVFSMLNFITISGHALFVCISSFLFVKKRNIFTFILVILSVYMVAGNQSSTVLASAGLIAILLFPDFLSNILDRNFDIKFLLTIFLLIIVVFFGLEQIYSMIYADKNAIWRLQYWLNDVRVFAKTFGIGVGFGTTYATDDLFNTIINASALRGGLFVTAQHSSLINMFYRMGIIGGIYFVNLHLSLMKWVGNTLKKNREVGIASDNKWIVWAFGNFVFHFIIIMLNPGIESPKFFWGYLCFWGILVGFLCRSVKTEIRNKELSEEYN